MPPKTQEIKPPQEGESAIPWLESYGLVAEQPPIRSSDYETVLGNPFSYYLHRRLGLSDALRWSEALSRGSWFHKRFEYCQLPDDQAGILLDKSLEERKEELTGICKEMNIQADERKNIIEREVQDFQVTSAWYDAIKGKPMEWINQSHFRFLGSEIKAIYHDDRFPGTPLIAQFDALLYHEEQNSLWVVDLKTCGESPTDRLQTCTIEYQTQHYIEIARLLVASGELQESFELPADVRVAGMAHIAVQKPTINFGLNDRDFQEEEHTLKSGPRKGQVEIRRKYLGEPRYENYVARCKRWYAGEGEYEHAKVDREENPPVNISYTFNRRHDPQDVNPEWYARTKMIHHYATIPPEPSNFPKSASSLRSFGKLSKMAPFYLTGVAQWINIIKELRLITLRRDEEVPGNSGIY